MTRLLKLLREEAGANLTEYALLLALVVLGSAALVNSSNSSLSGIWGTANATLNGSFISGSGSSGSGSTSGGGSSSNGGDNGDGNHDHGDHGHDHGH